MRLAILSTHPIQYHGHWFRALAQHGDLELEVLYCYYASPIDQAKAGFGVEFDWDIPVLEGYRYRFLNNVGSRRSPDDFLGLDTPEIAEILARENFDAVLVNGWHYKAAWQAMTACWKRHVPVMVRGDSQLLTPRGQLKRALKYPFYRTFIPRVNACLAVGTRSREYYLHYGAQPERIFLVPHAIDAEVFMRAAEQVQPRRQPLRHQWKLEERNVVFLFAGKFIEKKRPLDFVRGIEAAARVHGSVTGLMAGDGPLRSSCQQYAESRNLPVRFTGFLNQSQMVEAYVAADVLAVPSDARETWGLVVNEAMACGRPAIVSDAVGCAPDLVHQGKTGGMFALGDVEGLARMMCEFAEQPARLVEMGHCARSGLGRFSLATAVHGVLDAMVAVARENRN